MSLIHIEFLIQFSEENERSRIINFENNTPYKGIQKLFAHDHKKFNFLVLKFHFNFIHNKIKV